MKNCNDSIKSTSGIKPNFFSKPWSETLYWRDLFVAATYQELMVIFEFFCLTLVSSSISCFARAWSLDWRISASCLWCSSSSCSLEIKDLLASSSSNLRRSCSSSIWYQSTDPVPTFSFSQEIQGMQCQRCIAGRFVLRNIYRFHRIIFKMFAQKSFNNLCVKNKSWALAFHGSTEEWHPLLIK